MYDNFVIQAKRTVYKWWCVVYKPVYQLTHHGYWPAEKDPYMKYPTAQPENDPQKQMAQAMATQIIENNRYSQHSVDDIIQSVEKHVPVNVAAKDVSASSESNTSQTSNLNQDEIPAGTSDDVLARANEIMARLNQEAADDAAKKQAEIDKAKAYAAEQERLASIMKANHVDIEGFIEEGRSKQETEQSNANSNDLTIE